jgi:hypothetical protein
MSSFRFEFFKFSHGDGANVWFLIGVKDSRDKPVRRCHMLN